VLVMLGCVRVPSPTFVEHSKPRRPQHPMLGRFLDAAQKTPARNGLVFPMQRLGGITRVQSSGVAACCLVNRGQA
jgi:hypothetical protein